MKADRVWSTAISFVFQTPWIEAIIPVLLRKIPVVEPSWHEHMKPLSFLLITTICNPNTEMMQTSCHHHIFR
jgi:hypothetical protein